MTLLKQLLIKRKLVFVFSLQKMSKTTIAVGQMRSGNDKTANMAQVQELVCRSKAKNASMLFLPECCDFLGESRKETVALAEPLNGSTMTQYKELAKCNSLWISLGGIHERSQRESNDDKSPSIYNTHALINDEGKLVCAYRKLHLFDAETKQFRLRESDTVLPGTELLPPVSTPCGQLGLQICYDLRFAEPAILLRRLGAQVLTYPAAFTYTTGKAHWEILLRARAIETQCFVVAAAQQGEHNKKRQSWGHALIIDPWGKVLADCGGDEPLTLATAEIDLNKLEPLYESIPCFQHRRDDIYSLTMFDVPQRKEFSQDRLFADNVIDKRTIFFESEYCFAFTNLRCVVEGHVLVSTKRITPRLNGLNCAEMSDLFTTVCRIQRMLESFYGTTSATVTVQDGSEAGQSVPHVHFHVMPRRVGDFGHSDQIYRKLDDLVKDKPPRSLEDRINEAECYCNYIKSNQ